MAQNTPGPWKFFRDASGDRVIEAPNAPPSRGSLMCDMRYYPWCPESDADWHLIAAAPDLLDALQMCIGVMKLQRDVIERGKHAAAWNPAITEAEAAIAKATGA